MNSYIALQHGGQSAFAIPFELVGNGTVVKLEALGNEAVLANLSEHADDENFGAMLGTKQKVIHRFVDVLALGLGEFDLYHERCPSEDSDFSDLSSHFFT